MAAIIKRIPVLDKDEAVRVVEMLTEKYRLSPTDPDNELDVSNPKLHLYYDAGHSVVIVETNDAETVGEQLKELLVDFPTFF